jgi:hypothetical protein
MKQKKIIMTREKLIHKKILIKQLVVDYTSKKPTPGTISLTSPAMRKH